LFCLVPYDLQRTDSNERLEQISDPLYIGLPYFRPEETQEMKDTVIPGKKLSQIIHDSLHERLNRRIKKSVSNNDFRACAAHDLAPILEKALGIDPKQLSRDKDFLHLLDTAGLKLEDNKWEGL
jgi:hypothetical protein